jgi:cobaltochelatase CobT
MTETGAPRDIRRQQRIKEAGGAAVRALAADPTLHFRSGRLHAGDQPFPATAPHLRVSPTEADLRSFRGAADGLACGDATVRRAAPAQCPHPAQPSRGRRRVRAARAVAGRLSGLPPGRGRQPAAPPRELVAGLPPVRPHQDPERAAPLCAGAGLPVEGHRRARGRGDRGPDRCAAVRAAARHRRRPGRDAQVQRRPGGIRGVRRGGGRHGGRVARGGRRRRLRCLVGARARGFLPAARRHRGTDTVLPARCGESRVLAADPGDYRVFTRAHDRVCEAGRLVRPDLLLELRNRLDRRAATQGVNVPRLARTLQLLLATPERSNSPSTRTGTFDCRSTTPS